MADDDLLVAGCGVAGLSGMGGREGMCCGTQPGAISVLPGFVPGKHAGADAALSRRNL